MIALKNTKVIRRTVYTALFAALAFVATVVIHIHIPGPGATGYVNFGDCVVLASGLLLGPIYGGLAAGIGCALGDAWYAHIIYVPGTFVIKFLMAFVSCVIYRLLSKNKNDYKLIPITVAAAIGEVIMVLGYLMYETALPGINFAAALIGVPANTMQALAGVVLSVLIIKIMKKTNLTDLIKM